MAKELPRRLHKPLVIERIFFAKYDAATEMWLGSPTVTLDEVARTIDELYSSMSDPPRNRLSSRNPANFFKDIIRSKGRNGQWPQSVLEAGFTGRQRTGGGACFEFVPLPAGQSEPFVDTEYPRPSSTTPVQVVQSVSMPLASRLLGRRDEPWLMQVAVALNIVETHLALHSPVPGILQVDHLQMNLKLRNSEVDGVYLAVREADEIIITVEAKGLKDDILPDQLLRQVRDTFAIPTITQDEIVPMAIKIVSASTIHVVEFDAVARVNLATTEHLLVVSDALYQLQPMVPGISD